MIKKRPSQIHERRIWLLFVLPARMGTGLVGGAAGAFSVVTGWLSGGTLTLEG